MQKEKNNLPYSIMPANKCSRNYGIRKAQFETYSDRYFRQKVSIDSKTSG